MLFDTTCQWPGGYVWRSVVRALIVEGWQTIFPDPSDTTIILEHFVQIKNICRNGKSKTTFITTKDSRFSGKTLIVVFFAYQCKLRYLVQKDLYEITKKK
jgi:hypothetical protein